MVFVERLTEEAALLHLDDFSFIQPGDNIPLDDVHDGEVVKVDNWMAPT